jgi:DNA-binding LytR/AlgR family response regulator
MQNFVRIHTTTKQYLITHTMKAMEEILPQHAFMRVHKSFIVAINAITSLFGNTIEIGEIQIPIGSNYKDELMSRIER